MKQKVSHRRQSLKGNKNPSEPTLWTQRCPHPTHGKQCYRRKDKIGEI